MNRQPDPLDHLADALAEDILEARPERLLAEAAEDHGEPAALAAAFDRVAARAAQQAQPRQAQSPQAQPRRLADRIGALAAMLAPKRSWRPAMAAVAGVAVIVVAGNFYWHGQPNGALPESAPSSLASPIAAAQDREVQDAVVAQNAPPPGQERQAEERQAKERQAQARQDNAAYQPAMVAPPARTLVAPPAAPAPPPADQPRRVKTVVIGGGGGPMSVAQAPLVAPRPPVADQRLAALLDAEEAQARGPMSKAATLPPSSAAEAFAPEPSASALSRSGVAPQIPGQQSFDWPLRGRLLARFAPASRGVNDGIDIAAPAGTDVRAAAEGVVIYAGSAAKGFGNMIVLRHRDGLVTVYGYASRIVVKAGDAVRRGQVIAQSGASGAASEPQLHFEIRRRSIPIDPVPLLPPG